MGRLIDVDKFCEKTFKKGRFVFQWHDMLNEQVVFETVYNDFAEAVMDIPTAYDVDKVVNMLKRHSFTSHVEEADGISNSRRAVYLDTAIRIVKGGGFDD